MVLWESLVLVIFSSDTLRTLSLIFDTQVFSLLTHILTGYSIPVLLT
jgi:hypothetical protein